MKKENTIPEGMRVFVFYGYKNPGQKPREPNGRTVAFLLPDQIEPGVGMADPLVGMAVTSKEDQFCRKLGRTIAIGRALASRKHWASGSNLEANGLYGEDGKLMIELAAPILRATAEAAGLL
jgi:hypothetical protein